MNINKKIVYSIVALLLITIMGTYYVSIYKHKQVVTTEPTPEEIARQHSKVKSFVSTSIDGKDMVYIDKDYNFTFKYPKDWLAIESNMALVSIVKGVNKYSYDKNYDIYSYQEDYRIDVTVVPSKTFTESIVADPNIKLSTTTLLINGYNVLRSDTEYLNSSKNVVGYDRSYVISIPKSVQSVWIYSNNQDNSKPDFDVIDNIVKSLDLSKIKNLP